MTFCPARGKKPLLEFLVREKERSMGKGDLRTKKGKRHRGTYGKTRPKPGVERKIKEERKQKEESN